MLLRDLRFRMGRFSAAPASAPDPIDHPDLWRISLRELADQPFPRPSKAEESDSRLPQG